MFDDTGAEDRHHAAALTTEAKEGGNCPLRGGELARATAGPEAALQPINDRLR